LPLVLAALGTVDGSGPGVQSTVDCVRHLLIIKREAKCVPRQFDGRICVLCGFRPSSPTGEHAWTKWFLSLFPESEGPYTRYINGEPEKKRDGSSIRTQTSAERVKLPCCVECNGIMERRFEPLAKAILRRVMDEEGLLTLDAGEARVLGLWLVKTWLLLAHPAARGSMPGQSPRRWDLRQIPDDIYTWIVTGTEPPPGFSLWVARADHEHPSRVESRRIPVPIVVADGRTTAFQVFRCGVRFLDVTLAYHPGWEIAHPLEIERRALRLWPFDRSPVNLGSLPAVPTRDTVWIDGPTLEFAPGHYGAVPLPPIGADGDLMFSELPGLVFAAAPRLATSA